MPSQRNDDSVLRAPCSALRTPHSALAVRAFTLVEMLTVIAIIGILAAILIPTVSTAMKNARIATAKADVSKLTQAATAYNLDFGAFPPDCTAFWGTRRCRRTARSPEYGAATPAMEQRCTAARAVQHLAQPERVAGVVLDDAVQHRAVHRPARLPGRLDRHAWPSGPIRAAATGDWTPSTAITVFSPASTPAPTST